MTKHKWIPKPAGQPEHASLNQRQQIGPLYPKIGAQLMVEIRFLFNQIDTRALIGPCSHVTSRCCQSVTPGMSPAPYYSAYSNWSLATYPFFSSGHLLVIQEISYSKSPPRTDRDILVHSPHTELKGKCTIRMTKVWNERILVTFQIRPPTSLSSYALLSYGLLKWVKTMPVTMGRRL